MENLVEIIHRKIHQKGDRGLAVSLPSAWSSKNKVKPSEEIIWLQAPDSDDLILRLKKSKRKAS